MLWHYTHSSPVSHHASCHRDLFPERKNRVRYEKEQIELIMNEDRKARGRGKVIIGYMEGCTKERMEGGEALEENPHS